MAVYSGANEIMLAVDECARRTQDLRERMESDFSLWRLDPFQLGKVQGDYSDVTSNAPAVLANRVVEILSDARLRFLIPLADEDEAARAQMALTERFVQGALNLADQRLAGTDDGHLGCAAAAAPEDSAGEVDDEITAADADEKPGEAKQPDGGVCH